VSVLWAIRTVELEPAVARLEQAEIRPDQKERAADEAECVGRPGERRRLVLRQFDGKPDAEAWRGGQEARQ